MMNGSIMKKIENMLRIADRKRRLTIQKNSLKEMLNMLHNANKNKRLKIQKNLIKERLICPKMQTKTKD